MNKRRAIMVVDDQDIFLAAMKATLEEVGFHAIPVNDPIAALQLFKTMELDGVVTDIRMPGMSGIGLLKAIKAVRNVPVILVTGFSEIHETKEAFDLGADGFLAKPFKKAELVSALNSALDKKLAEPTAAVSEQALADLDLEYAGIPISEFVTGSNIRYSIHVRLGMGKYVKVAHNGENMPENLVARLRDKGVINLYLSKEDFRSYVGFGLRLSHAVRGNNAIPNTQKLALITATGSVIVGQLHLEGVDEARFQETRSIVESTVSMLSENETTFNLLSVLNGHTDYLYAHCLGVSVYAAMVAKKIKWSGHATQFKVAMAGIFHDIGKKEIDREILKKSRNAMTAEEVKIIETHPKRGAEILATIPGIGDEVIQVALQHHENCLGTGYPRRLSAGKIAPLGKLIHMVDDFCKFTIKNPDNPTGMSPISAIQRMSTMKAGEYDPVFFKALEELFIPTE